jgi:hypothetical protein
VNSSKSLTEQSYWHIISRTLKDGQGMLRLIFITFVLLMSLVQLSCKTNDKSSVLIIAVDELISTDVPCSDNEDRSGFQLICQESVRFTHAFTPSTMSVPSLASMLTGLYPYQHKVRHNGGPGLAPEFELASEVALRSEYRTAFFSGGAPVFRRSGLQQGFELFEDNINPNFGALYRPLKKNIPLFTQWLKEIGSNSFFSVLYVPDLLFTATPTTTNLGELRNLTFDSQLEELDESLLELFNHLKATNRWDNTTFFLVGLIGHRGGERPGQVAPLNLHSENTQVALYIKPTQLKKRDQAIYWKMDQNVSLVDIGRTLFELLGESVLDPAGAEVLTHSLMPALKSPSPDLGPEDRVLIVESGWGPWRAAASLKTAAMSGHVLYINDAPPLLYNTLVDRLETNPLPLLQESILKTTRKLEGVLQKEGFPPFSPLSNEWRAKLSIPFSRWLRADHDAALLKYLRRRAANYSSSLNLANWTAQIALNQKDWETLKNIGIKNHVALWQYVAERNLNMKRAKIEDSCFALLTSDKVEASRLKACSDPLFLELIDWLRADARGLVRETQRAKFERSFRNYMLDQQIQRTNIAAGLIWDTSRENVFAPSRAELALHLPELTRTRLQVYKSVSAPELESP